MKRSTIRNKIRKSRPGIWLLSLHLFRPTAGEMRRVALIEASDLFDRDPYLAQLNPLNRAFVRFRPALHFLRYGAEAGLNPSSRFETTWYLQQNPDVAATQLNPLVHFLENGHLEGRRPAPHIHLSDLAMCHGTPAYYRYLLWHGFANLALPPLTAMLNGEHDATVRWYLAGWHYAHDRFAQALAYLEPLMRQPRPDSVVAVGYLKSLLQLGRDGEVSAWLESAETHSLSDEACGFFEASVNCRPASARLGALNRLFLAHGRLPVSQKNPSASLSLDNLTAEAKRPRLHAGSRPKVSVVIPTHNAAETLPIALESVLNQTWGNLEVIVVDDCSSDATATLVEACARRDTRVRYLRHERNRGAYAARNTGMQASTGEFVTVHDCDDWSHPEKIELQVSALLKGEEGVGALTQWARVDGELRFTGSWNLDDAFLEANLSSLMVPRRVLREIGYWDPVNVAADSEFIERLKRCYGQAAIITVSPAVPLSFSLVAASSLTRAPGTHVKTVFYGLRRIYRQAARWWHGRHPFPVLPMFLGERPFPAPLGNLRYASRRFDVAVVANLSDTNPALRTLLQNVLKAREVGQSVALCHWPDARHFGSTRIADDVFELCLQEHVALADPAAVVRCDTLYLEGEVSLWSQRPDQVPRITVEGPVYWAGSTVAVDAWLADPLLDYFAMQGQHPGVLLDDAA